ncbi:MAG: YicC family protein [Phycisphaeraceae bacterium]|nr:YicC family protein [Phycisphaeraceae bacterium]
MIRSMTGFGDASMTVGSGPQGSPGGVHYFIEVRSLNSKYFKAIIRLPEQFQALEAEIESELRRRLGRGSVFLSAQCSDSSGETGYTINDKALSAYIEQLKRLPQVQSGQVKVDLGPLLALPGVLLPPANEEERLERARQALTKLLAQACDRLIAMRGREGAALRTDLLQRRDAIADRLRHISARAPDTLLEYERRLKLRIDTMINEAGLKVEPADVVREIAVYAERTDITEEITRLSGHIEQFTQLLERDDGKPVGRTLDFLSQEMLREANTIASKCADSEISRHIVEVKGEIDRIKEQVQNVE